MARYLTAALLVISLYATLIWLVREEPAIVDVVEATSSVHDPALGGEIAASAGEVEALGSGHSLSLGACDEEEESSIEERLEEWDALKREMGRVLASSAESEHLMVAALVTGPEIDTDAMAMMREAAAMDPGNPIIAAQMLVHCAKTSSCVGSQPQFERALIMADKANVNAWMLVANSRLLRDDEPGALQAMQEAVAAATVDDHFIDYVLTFDRALAASSDLNGNDRLVAAFGFAATYAAFPGVIYADCVDKGATSAMWNDLCLKLGVRLEHESRTILAKAIGLGMQVRMYELGGDSRSHIQAQQRLEEFRSHYRKLLREAGEAEKLKDLAVFHRYVEIFAASDELEASEYLANQVRERMPELLQRNEKDCQNP